MIIVIDNYDSFTYNIVQEVAACGAKIEVIRNDSVSVADLVAKNPKALVISPGPCTPDKAGITEDAVRAFAGRVPVLGVCLGMQAIGEVYGGRIVRASRIMHGKTSEITHSGDGVFSGLPNPLTAVRYHSLAVERDSLPAELRITATADGGEIMGLRHAEHDVEGVQFHPESILSEHGATLLRNWVGRVLGTSGLSG